MNNLPDSFCIDIVAEKDHPRLNEFKDWYCMKSNYRKYKFNLRYYGYTSNGAVNGNRDLWTIISLDQLFAEISSEPITSIKVGDEFLCIKEWRSKAGNVLYTKGQVYRCERKNSITDNADNGYHNWMYKGNEIHNKGLNRYFIRHQSQKEEAVEPIGDVIPVSSIDTPSYYDNSKGSLYKIAQDRGWNAYQLDIIKRIDRCEKKGQYFNDLKKTKDLIDLYQTEQGHKFKQNEEDI